MTSRARSFFLRSMAGLFLPALLAACGGNVVVTGGGEGGDGGSGGTKPDGCLSGLTKCGDECVDTSSNWDHCGGCFVSCGDGVCDGGDCLVPPACSGGLTFCGGDCVDTQTDPAHCGGCFQGCPASSPCSGGDCVSGCPCGLCDVVDLGSGVPQSASVGVAGLSDTFVATCGFEGGKEIAFQFTAPFSGPYTFDTLGSVDTSLEIKSAGCEFFGCDDDSAPDGTSSLSLELGGGQVVLVVVETTSASGTITLNIQQGTDCATCGEYISGDVSADLCDSSSLLYNELASCVCEEKCAMICQDLCSGFDPSPECQGCVLDSQQGCGNQYEACANDF